MGRTNTITTHVERRRIDRMLTDGVSYAEIVRTVGGVSLSALGRYALSRKGELSKLVDDEPGVTDILTRLTEVADHARQLRRESRSTATPAAQARAIKAELESLSKLTDKLGIDQLATETMGDEFRAFAMALKIFQRTYPDSAADLLTVLKADEHTKQLALSLESQGKKNSND